MFIKLPVHSSSRDLVVEIESRNVRLPVGLACLYRTVDTQDFASVCTPYGRILYLRCRYRCSGQALNLYFVRAAQPLPVADAPTRIYQKVE